jgi:hypothetical protein
VCCTARTAVACSAVLQPSAQCELHHPCPVLTLNLVGRLRRASQELLGISLGLALLAVEVLDYANTILCM